MGIWALENGYLVSAIGEETEVEEMNKPVNEAYVERGSRGGRGAVEKGKVGRKSQSVKGKGKQGRKKN